MQSSSDASCCSDCPFLHRNQLIPKLHAFNFYMFDGEQVIKPEELHPLDTTAIALPFGDDSPSKPVQKYRDVLKYIAAMAAALALSANACMISQVSAAGGAVDASSFISTACTVLKSVIILIGGGVGFLGIMNLLEAYGSDNAAARSQGIKQLMAGLGLILLAITLVPVLQTMMSSAV